MAHEHEWIDITTVMDIERQYVCGGCSAKKVGEYVHLDPLDAMDAEMQARDSRSVEEALEDARDAPKNDGWDGMRRFLKQMDEGRE